MRIIAPNRLIASPAGVDILCPFTFANDPSDNEIMLEMAGREQKLSRGRDLAACPLPGRVVGQHLLSRAEGSRPGSNQRVRYVDPKLASGV